MDISNYLNVLVNSTPCFLYLRVLAKVKVFPHAGHYPLTKGCLFKQNLHINEFKLISLLSPLIWVSELNFFYCTTVVHFYSYYFVIQTDHLIPLLRNDKFLLHYPESTAFQKVIFLALRYIVSQIKC